MRSASHSDESDFDTLCSSTHGTIAPTSISITAMRTLVDLLSNEHGYARIYADSEGYGYELCTYLPRPIADLFARMAGYHSVSAARTAAEHQLSAVYQVRRSRKRSARAAKRPSQQLPHALPI